MDRTNNVDPSVDRGHKISMRGTSGVQQVLVFSGSKGGVGKTTTMINLAKTLKLQNFRVGIIDLTGSAELFLSASTCSESTSQKPRELSGISIVSQVHLKQNKITPPASTSHLKNWLLDIFDQTAWGKLDFLFIDVPTGNMELALFLGEILPRCLFLPVTTPAKASISALRQDIRLLQAHQLSVHGLIENMSFFICEDSENPLELIGIFSAGGGQRISEETKVPLLCTIPIMTDISIATEEEKPVCEQFPDSDALAYYQDLAHQVLPTHEASKINPGPL